MLRLSNTLSEQWFLYEEPLQKRFHYCSSHRCGGNLLGPCDTTNIRCQERNSTQSRQSLPEQTAGNRMRCRVGCCSSLGSNPNTRVMAEECGVKGKHGQAKGRICKNHGIQMQQMWKGIQARIDQRVHTGMSPVRSCLAMARSYRTEASGRPNVRVRSRPGQAQRRSDLRCESNFSMVEESCRKDTGRRKVLGGRRNALHL